MSRKNTLVFWFVFSTFYMSFSQGTWTQKASFGGTVRERAVGFSIGTKAYIGTGDINIGAICYQDFWEWDQTTDTWTQKADFGGGTRFRAVGFSIGDKGYIGTGSDASLTFYQDFWEYDTTANIWTQKANFGGGARILAVGFSIGGKGYIGTGNNGASDFNDFWEYDPLLDTWTAMQNVGGGPRSRAVGFSIGTKAYIGTGSTPGFSQDFWEWDQTTNTWSQKQNFGGTARRFATGFSIGGKGYIGAGNDSGGETQDFWEYDTLTNQWTQKANFGGGQREAPVGFSIGCRGYIGTGGGGPWQKDLWEFNPVEVNLVVSQSVLCNGQCTGAGTATPSGGTNPYAYLWGNSQSTQTATGLCVGGYTCTVTDSFGCSNMDSIIITEPDTLIISLLSQINVACDGENNGSASVLVTGGTVPYTYSWNTIPAQISSTASNLTADNYIATVTDSNGCTASLPVTIIQPLPLIVTVASTNVSCYGGNNGSATTAVSGGTPSYMYSWSSGGTAAAMGNLSAGNYTITVTDSNNCTTVDSITITEPLLLTTDISSFNNVSCAGNNDGSATALVSGGTLPYNYSWSSGETVTTINNLVAGSYTITVTDSNSCIATDSVIITEPPMLSATVISSVNVHCNGGTDGSATVNTTGGTLPYTYSWSSGATAAIANNLVAGSYTITVTDSNSCVSADSIIISEPQSISLTLNSIQAICTGNSGSATAIVSGGIIPYIYQWSSGATTAIVNSLSAGTYTLTVADSNGCIKVDSVTITSLNSSLQISSSTIPAICTNNTGSAAVVVSNGTPPYSYIWSSGGVVAIEDSLAAGSYTVTVTDSNSCTQTQTVIIASTNPLTLTVTSTPTACDTPTGTGTATPANGTQPYTYSWTTVPVQTTATSVALNSGTYTVTVVDSNGCSQTQGVSIAQITGPVAVVAATITTISYGSNTQLIGLGGENYSWTPVTGLSCTNCQNPSAVPLETTTYCVTVADTNGCTDSACIKITVEIPCGTLEVPNAFSPNNDGHNDYFILQGAANCVDDFQIRIFDRWGEKVFETKSLFKIYSIIIL